MQISTRTDDIDNQSVGNYSYDLNGRLVSDVKDGVTLIKWSKSDKVLEVHKPNGVLTIKYNALDQKVSQSTSRNDSIVTEYFVYDPSGNVLATYGDTIFTTNGHHRFALHQLTIYGSSRIGLLEVDSLLWKDGSSNIATVSGATVYSQILGLKRYELSNHLGNVTTVVSDRKLVDSHSNGQISSWKADVISVTDYYAFGMKITERTWSSDTYRFGFNGKDFFSDWNRQDYGFRIYDPRKCRFESVDPLASSYPWNSTYAFAENRCIDGIDLEGLEYKSKRTGQSGPYSPKFIAEENKPSNPIAKIPDFKIKESYELSKKFEKTNEILYGVKPAEASSTAYKMPYDPPLELVDIDYAGIAGIVGVGYGLTKAGFATTRIVGNHLGLKIIDNVKGRTTLQISKIPLTGIKKFEISKLYKVDNTFDQPGWSVRWKKGDVTLSIDYHSIPAYDFDGRKLHYHYHFPSKHSIDNHIDPNKFSIFEFKNLTKILNESTRNSHFSEPLYIKLKDAHIPRKTD